MTSQAKKACIKNVNLIFDCPKCEAETTSLIDTAKWEKHSCPACGWSAEFLVKVRVTANES